MKTKISLPYSHVQVNWPLSGTCRTQSSHNFLKKCFNIILTSMSGTRGSVAVEALGYKPKARGFETQWGEWIFSSYLILPATLGPGVYSASNRNEYQCFWAVECGRCVGLTTLPPTVSRLSRHCGIPNISRLYKPPRPLTETALLILLLLLGLPNGSFRLKCGMHVSLLPSVLRYLPVS
jgi:hypothetical protein